jgi:hypothetical protein
MRFQSRSGRNVAQGKALQEIEAEANHPGAAEVAPGTGKRRGLPAVCWKRAVATQPERAAAVNEHPCTPAAQPCQMAGPARACWCPGSLAFELACPRCSVSVEAMASAPPPTRMALPVALVQNGHQARTASKLTRVACMTRSWRPRLNYAGCRWSSACSARPRSCVSSVRASWR